MKYNVWILTEERPKLDVVETILKKIVAYDRKIAFFCDFLRILPILDENKKFTFTYEVVGFTCNKINKIYIKTVSGTSSFVDYLVFCQDDEPTGNDTPSYAIEETKTGGKESRNTSVLQRLTKFVYIRQFYPQTPLIMLYRITRERSECATTDFGMRLLLTLGVKIVGWEQSEKFQPFANIDELIDAKNAMRQKKGNVSIVIMKGQKSISISGRLIKDGRLAHDPNIGALTGISYALRLLGWEEEIQITQHGLQQSSIGSGNKFVQLANRLGITLEGLTVPQASLPDAYWFYEKHSEKLGTIFIHLVVENFTRGFSIFENHAGCEKGYFHTSEGKEIELEKYQDRTKYKAGDKRQRLSIPDLILLDFDALEVINIEGKKSTNIAEGLRDLENYDAIEERYVKKYYPNYKIIRTLVLYGGIEEQTTEVKVGFWLNQNGSLILGIKAPRLFTEAIANLLDFWKE